MAKLKGGTRIYGSIIVDDQTLIGSATTTGTGGQSLQIAGINSGAYIGGRVGIGTTNPSVPLEVSGAVRATVYYGDGSNLTGIVASGGSSGGTSLSISTSTSSSTNFISFVSSASTSILGITTSIGLTYIPSASILNVGIISIGSGIVTATSGIVTYYGDGSKLTGIQTAGAGVAAGGTFTQIQFNDSGILNGASFFNYDKTTARVGIGTSLPSARLSVASTSTGNSLLIVNDNLSDGTLFRVNDNSANVLMDVDANGTILFLNSGNIGIGSTLVAPSTKLQVIGTVTATTFSGNFTGTAATISTAQISSGIITAAFTGNLTGTAATISTVQISSGIITATSGVVTYYGYGGNLTGILTSGSAGGSTGQLQYNLGGVPSGANFFNYDNTTARVGIGTSLPSARLSVASTTTGNSLLIVNDNLSDGTLFRVNDNSANVLMDVDANGTILFLNSGNIGIGSTLTSPTSKLQVTGDVLISGAVTATTYNNVRISSGIVTATSGVVTYYGDGSKLTGIVALTNVGVGASGQIQFNDGGPLGGASFFNYDKTTARVGIGTSTPTARLSVASTTTGTSLLIVNDNLSDGSLFRVNDNSANVLMDVDANGTILFLNSGNIGIGSTLTSPTSKLQVTGDALVSGVVTATTFSGNLSGIALTVTTGIITNITSVNENVSGITTTQRLNVGTGGTIIATTTTGLVGIGTSVPTSRFNVSSPSSGASLMLVNDNLSDGALFRVNDNSANVLMDVDANGTILFLNSGNIGIGSTLQTPTSKLHVIGNTLIAGVTTITGNLNAAGNYYVKIARTTNQTIPNGVDTLIGFSTISDPNSWYTGITTRTTPTVAGTYQVNAMLNWQAGSVTNQQTNIQLRKNGTSFALSQVGVQTFAFTMNACGIVTMNGTSDYIDFTAYTGNPTNQVVNGTADGAWTKLELFKIN
jgi:hypothetical protein